MEILGWDGWFRSVWYICLGVLCIAAIWHIEDKQKRKLFIRLSLVWVYAYLVFLWIKYGPPWAM